MSLANLNDFRSEVAVAINAISASTLTGYQYRPRTTSNGDVWALLDSIEREQVSGQYEVTWKVVVVVPSDEQSAMECFATWADDITDALEDLAYIERIEPGLLPSEAGDMNCMFLTLRREA